MNREAYETKIAEEAIRTKDLIERDFVMRHGGPTAWILAAARLDAIDALRTLADVDPTNALEITRLQNDVKRNRDLIDWLHRAVERGEEAWQKLRGEEQDTVAAVLGMGDDEV